MTTRDELRRIYSERYEKILIPLAINLELHINERFIDIPHIDRVSVRAKSVERFLTKAQKTNVDGKRKYSDPLNQIQDQIGARIVVFYLSDIQQTNDKVKDYYSPIEEKSFIPDTANEFGYEGKHYTLFIPMDLLPPDITKNQFPKFFELQIKTLFEHAWAEANHDLAFKPQSDLTREQQRKIAFTAAQAWGADLIFNQLLCEMGDLGEK